MNILAFLWYIVPMMMIAIHFLVVFELQNDPNPENTLLYLSDIIAAFSIFAMITIYPTLFVAAIIERYVRKKNKSESKLFTKLHQSVLYKIFYYFGHICIGIPSTIYILLMWCAFFSIEK